MTCGRCAGFVVLEYEDDGALHPRCVNCGGREVPRSIESKRAELNDLRCVETLLNGQRCKGRRYIDNPYCQRHQKIWSERNLDGTSMA